MTITVQSSMDNSNLIICDNEISQDEMELYKLIVAKSAVDRSFDNINKLAIDYLYNTYAIVRLAKNYKVIDNFCYQEIMNTMKNVNDTNRERLNKGEVVMGLIKYSVVQFFEYFISNIKVKTIKAIAKNPNEDIIRHSKEFYHQNKNNFISEILIEYVILQSEVGESQNSQVKKITYAELRTIQKIDESLFNILLSGVPQQQYTLNNRTIKVVSRKITYYDFDRDTTRIIQSYINNGYYNMKINELAEDLKVSI